MFHAFECNHIGHWRGHVIHKLYILQKVINASLVMASVLIQLQFTHASPGNFTLTVQVCFSCSFKVCSGKILGGATLMIQIILR